MGVNVCVVCVLHVCLLLHVSEDKWRCQCGAPRGNVTDLIVKAGKGEEGRREEKRKKGRSG